MRAHPAGALHGGVVPLAAHSPGIAGDVGRLDPKIWPLTAERRQGALTVGGLDCATLVSQHGTPLFVVDEADVRTRCRAYRDAFGPDTDIYYAVKANSTRAVLRWVTEEGLSFDVSTGGELALALSAGVPGDRILLHGNNKSVDEIQAAVAAAVGRIVVDNLAEIGLVARIAAAAGVIQSVLVRVTVGVEAHTHEFIATAHEDQKFGLSLAGGAALEACRLIEAAPSLRLTGLHSHIGSQIFDTAGFEVAAHRVVGLAAQLRNADGITVGELDLGGGLGIPYVADDDPTDVAEVAKQLQAIVARECEASGLPLPRLAVEPGRAIVGQSTVTVYEVGTVKNVDGIRTYVAVDGGMSDNLRTALYDADFTCTLASRASTAPPVLARVVGKHCEAGDVVVRDAWLPGDIAAGDLLAVATTGAYCRSLASNYNALPRPAMVAVADGEARLVVRRETIEDLLSLELG
jgi:diaminopimelate decarboxylase